MPKSGEKASERERDEHQDDSVFDFLYCDSGRIGSFLAQFDESGHLEKVIQRDAAGKGTKRGFKFSVGGGGSLLGTGASANLGIERGPHDEGSESSERVYDPLWTNARTLLDFLEDRSLIERDLSQARIGQIALVTGILAISDLSLSKILLDMPVVGPKIAMSIQDETMKKFASVLKHTNVLIDHLGDVVLAFLRDIPTSAVANMRCGDISVWGTLVEKFMVVTISDIILKYGGDLDGDWSMLGIVDALPSTERTDEDIRAEIVASQNASKGSWPQVAATIAKFGRRAIGRPAASYGMTPLLIFRTVSGSGPNGI